MKINEMLIPNFPSYTIDGLYAGYNYPKKIFVHNTAGGTSAYNQAVRVQDSSVYKGGVAHFYVDKDTIYQVIDTDVVAYANGFYEANDGAISIEICDGYGNVEDFKKAEKRALMLGHELAKKYNINPNSSTIMLHSEVYNTECPKVSAKTHGGYDKAKEYFTKTIKSGVSEVEISILKLLTQYTYDSSIHAGYYEVDGKKYGYFYIYDDNTESWGKNNIDTVVNSADMWYCLPNEKGTRISKTLQNVYYYKDSDLKEKVIQNGQHKYCPKNQFVRTKFIKNVTKNIV